MTPADRPPNSDSRNRAEPPDDPGPGEALFENLIVAYDEALAAGETPAPIDETSISAEILARLRGARTCLALLERGRLAKIQSPPTIVDDETFTLSGSSDLAEQRTFGRFEILRELGRGGLGVVLLAYDPVLKRKVALKIPRPEALLAPELRQRFAREGQAAARLTHPNLIAVYEVGEVGPVDYIAAAYCDGPNLSQWLEEQQTPVPPRRAAKIIAQLAGAVEYAHGQGVLHRDLKPSNVMLELHGALDRARQQVSDPEEKLEFTPKITDFGMARLDDSSGNETRAGIVLGTPAYMSPEQAEGGNAAVDRRTDVYALGAILYELIAGQPPFAGVSGMETLRQVISDEPVAPGRLTGKVPADLEAICLKCLQKLPSRRYETAGELAADLERYLSGQATVARPLGPGQKLWKWSRRRPALAALVGVSALALVIIGALTTVYISRLRDANLAAERSSRESQIQEQITSQFLYTSRMRLAYQSLDQGDVEQVSELLDAYEPGASHADLRGFEWYHLRQRLHGERLTLVGHQGEVYTLAFSPNGKQLVSGGQDGTIRLWDPQTGSQIKAIPAHRSCINAVAFSPDGSQLATGSCDHTVKLWDARTLACLETLPAADEVHCLAFCPTKPYWLAVGGHDRHIHVWDLDTHEIVMSLARPGDTQDLAWRHDASALLIGSYPNHSPGGTWWIAENRFEPNAWYSNAVATSAAGDEVWCNFESVIHVDAASDTPIASLTGHADTVYALAFSPLRRSFASGSHDHTIRVWDVAASKSRQILAGHSGRVQALAFSPDGSTLASGSFDGTIKLWGERSLDQSIRTARMCRLPDTVAERVALSADLRYLAVASDAHTIRVLNLTDDTLVGTLPCAEYPTALQFLPDGHTLLRAPTQSSRQAEEWDVDRWKSAITIDLPVDKLDDLARFGRALIVDSADGTLFSDANGQQNYPRDFLGDAVSWSRGDSVLIFSPDARSLIIRRSVGASYFFANENSRRPHASPLLARGLCISNGGKLLVSQHQMHSVSVLRVDDESVIGILRHPDAVHRAAFTPDGKTLATACKDQHVYLWNVATREEIARLPVSAGTFLHLKFSADGRRLAVVLFTPDEPVDPSADNAGQPNFPDLISGTATIMTWSGIETE